jgi:hypothetical protein
MSAPSTRTGNEVRTVMLKTFWMSWYEPTPDGEFAPYTWPLPKGNHYWCSGWVADESAATLCALVMAPSEEDAKKMVRRWWKHRRPTEWRFCNERPNGWTPGDRFPIEAGS